MVTPKPALGAGSFSTQPGSTANAAMAAMGTLLGGLGLGTSKTRGASMTELISTRAGEIHEAKTLREQQAAARRAQKACKATETPLLNGLGGA
jgi:hypothetical protein